MKEYRVSNGMVKIIQAEHPEDARDIFLNSFNECICEQVDVLELGESHNINKESLEEEDGK